jgi:hypothetical protein
VDGDPRGAHAAASTRPSPRSRRAFLAGGPAAATAALISACAGAKPLREKVRGGAKVSPSDVEPLNALLDVEHHAITAYAAGIPLLHPPQSKAAVQFLAQELAHASQLSDLIRHARHKPNRPRASYDLGNPRGPADVLALLKRLEQAQLAAYLEAIPRLSEGRVRAAVSAIFANDAQHLAMLRWQSGESPAPAARVTGSSGR